MRLLNVNLFAVESFVGEDVPSYTILSHTWGPNEVTFDDMKHVRSSHDFEAIAMSENKAVRQKNFGKIRDAAVFVQSQGHSHIWIDTCCIDKSSSAELSEAINSMFSWYRMAKVCYAYLADVVPNLLGAASFDNSRWWTRGWTLQELIAPTDLLFLDGLWKPIGYRSSLSPKITAITHIDQEILNGASLEGACAAKKLSWFAGRKTTRPEDIAYCLFGIMGVNMPLLYGEGAERAFLRLQEEFLRGSEDESIFAWRASPEVAQKKPYWGLLSPTPDFFAASSNFTLTPIPSLREGHPTMTTNRGLRIELSLSPLGSDIDPSGTIFLALLQCNRQGGIIAIILQRLSDHELQYARVVTDNIIFLNGSSYLLPSDRCRAPCSPQILHEPQPQYLFVRQTPRPSEQVAGFHMSPNSKISCLVDGHTGILELEAAEIHDPWRELWLTPHRRSRFYVIDFQRISSMGLDAASLKAPVGLGRCAIEATIWSNGARLRRSICFAVGLGPLPENPFGTPAGFVRPWFARIRDGIDGSLEQKCVAGTSIWYGLREDLGVEIGLRLGSHRGGVCYVLSFSVKGCG